MTPLETLYQQALARVDPPKKQPVPYHKFDRMDAKAVDDFLEKLIAKKDAHLRRI